MTQNLLKSDQLPYALYRAEQVRALDRTAIEQFGIPGLTLMKRAGAAAFALLRERWPAASDITVICGIGNNGGDGYVVAHLVLTQGIKVRVLQLGDPQRLSGDALICATTYRDAGGEVFPFQGLPRETDIVVDAVFGTGLEREITGDWREALEAINRHAAPVLALDIPSGIHSDTGRCMGVAVKADASITFIGLKQGMFTGSSPAYCGDIRFDALDVPAAVYASQILSARRLDWARLSRQITPRSRIAHKGYFGHVLVIGGNYGFTGAAVLAATAAARAGAGLVSVATRAVHAVTLVAHRPEVMWHGVESDTMLRSLLRRASVIAIGSGLGRDIWAQRMLAVALESGLPMVVDADALNLLADDPLKRDDWVLTPHPGEAARLLEVPTEVIQSDRFAAVYSLQQKYGGIGVLKGAGTLITDGGERPCGICSDGNPGMASGGMGDVLTGIIAALYASSIRQGGDLQDAVELSVCLHARAADAAARKGERGMLAGDLIEQLRWLGNPELNDVDA